MLITLNILTILIVIFWVMKPCNDVVGYRCFRGSCCLHLQGGFHGDEDKFEVFWVVTPCNDVLGYQYFRESSCLHTLKMEAARTSETDIYFTCQEIALCSSSSTGSDSGNPFRPVI
jgi:hypothetical protein